MDGGLTRSLGRQHARRGDDELHQQAEWWIGWGVRARGIPSAIFMWSSASSPSPETDPLLRHDQRPEDVDQALDVHAALGEGPGAALRRQPRRRQTEPYQIYDTPATRVTTPWGTRCAAHSWRASERDHQVARLGKTKSLIGKTEAEIREQFGAPVEIAGPRWQYSTANGILLFYAFFENGRVVRVRPENLRLTEVVPTR